MSRPQVLRVLVLGFALVVLLLCAAAYIGYEASRSLHDSVRELVRENLLTSDRAATLEADIERESGALLDELLWILGVCLCMALCFSAVTIALANRAFRKLEWQAEELSRVSWHMLQAHEMSARRLAHEMHDELGQSLTGLRGMLKRLSGAEFEGRRAESVQIMDEVLASVRELSQILRPVILDDLGLDAGLRWLATRFAQRTQVEVDYSSNLSERLCEELETHLFRIAQESLTNVARHSGATKISIRLEAHGDVLKLIVEDNGLGLGEKQPATGSSLGMVGMRARARQVGGELRVARVGWEVCVSMCARR